MLQAITKVPNARSRIALLALTMAVWTGELSAQGSVPSTVVSTAVKRSIPLAPDSRHVFVLDSAHLLSAAEIGALQDSARKLQTATGADVAFVTLPTLHGGAVEEAALAIGRAWKVGSSGAFGDPMRNRGLVMLYVPDKKSVAGANLRVEVGRGLEGAITDGGGSREILEAIKPPFRAKRYGEGFIAGFNVAALLISGEKPAQLPATNASPVVTETRDFPFAPVILSLIALVTAIAIFIAQRKRRPLVLDLTPRNDYSSSPHSIYFNLSQPPDSPTSSSGDDSGSNFDVSSSDSSSSSDGGSFGDGGGFSGGGASDSV